MHSNLAVKASIAVCVRTSSSEAANGNGADPGPGDLRYVRHKRAPRRSIASLRTQAAT